MKIIITSLCILLFGSVYATHIVGGGFDLQSLGNNMYRLTLVVYRDCENGQAAFNDPLTIGIFDKETDLIVDRVTMSKQSQSPINPTLAKCVQQVPGCNEKAVYTRIIELDPLLYNNFSGYYLSWERCCRNHIIRNIRNPQDASMTFYAEIPSPARYINSTPKLVNNPFTVLCIDNLFTYEIQFTDADNDSLVYEMITPVNGTLDRFNPNDNSGRLMLNSGPYKSITWLPEYSEDEPIPGNPPLNIDYRNGTIQVSPSEQGVFVVAFRVTEYRNGVAIGFVNLELQFTVVDCISNIPPVIKLFVNNNLESNSDHYVTIPDAISLRVNVFDEDELDTVIVESDFDAEPPEYLTTASAKSQKNADYSWNWQTYCALHNSAPKRVTITATDKGCPIPRTTKRTFFIHPLPMPLLPATDILCIELINNESSVVHFGDSTRNRPYFKQYLLYRADVGPLFYLYDSTGDRTAYKFPDLRTPDYYKINYSYFVRTQNECGYEGPSSDTLGSFDQLKALPDKQYMYNVTVQQNKWVSVKWNESPESDFARYFLYKGVRGMAPEQFKNIATFNKKDEITFLDKEVSVQDTSYCYYLVMLDTCGNIGPQGQVFCTTVIRGKADPFVNTLRWQRFPGRDEERIGYDLVKYPPAYLNGDSMFIPVGSFVDSAATDDKLDTDDGRYDYEVEVLHEPYGWNGLVERSRSNREPLIQKPLVHVPNAFTPNNDQLNDEWYVSDVFVRNYELKVFNRWGQLVFTTSDKNHKWNGVDLKGEQVPADVYVYLITYDGWDDRVRTSTGNVTVLK